MTDAPWQDEAVLRELYYSEGLSTTDLAERLGCSATTVRNWMDRFGLERRGPDYHGHTGYPWRDAERLGRMYWGDGMDQEEIAAELGCEQHTISKWLRRHDIPTRDSQKIAIEARRVHRASFRTSERGYEYWRARCGEKTELVAVHRLLAVAEYGFDAVRDKHVHHGKEDGHLPACEIPWANWPGNIQPLTPSQHKQYHANTAGRNGGRFV